jgi:glycosyltransferase involved in cell wall biosynthesis
MGLMRAKITVRHLDPAAFTVFYERPLIRALAAQGVEAHLFTSASIYDMTPPPEPTRETHFYFRLLPKLVNRSPLLRRPIRGLHYLYDQQRMTSQLSQQPPHIIHIHWALIPGVDKVVWRRWQQKGWRIVFTGHDLVPNHLPAGAARPYFDLYTQADALILHSAHNRDSLGAWLKRVLPSEQEKILQKTRVIPMGIPENDRNIDRVEARQMLNLPPDVPVILFLGNIRKYKGVPVLLAAFRRVVDRLPEAHLIVAGHVTTDFPGGAVQIRQLVAEIPNVRLELQFIPYNTAPVYYAAADVTALPYLYITQSAVALSALTRGCPMVASDVGGLSDVVIHGETGLLVPPEDSCALAEALLHLLQNPELRQKMSQNARDLAHRKFGWSAIAAQTRAVYEEVLA